jgi:Na+-transporting methylmalonyl-CoA/oxaloacetate decarboxylase gamma subunit
MVQVPSTKIFATGTLKVLQMCLVFVLVLFLVEAAAGISDAVPKLHQNTISVLGKSRTIGLSEEDHTL